MSTWSWIVASGWILICVSGVVRLIMVVIFRLNNTLQRRDADAARTSSPRVQVIVPACNEERDLPANLNAMLAQDYPNFGVLVVNDRSRDATERIAGEFAARDDRVRVHTIETLEPGWTGKAHAMWTATQRVEADWFLFVDVDVTLDPWAVRTALEEAERRQVELLTIFPRAAPEGFWQQVSLPLLGTMLAIWFDPFRVNSPDYRVGFVNGQFLMIRADAYARIDGHRAVRDFIIEDVPFGLHAKSQGVPNRLALGANIAQVRMYTSCSAMIDGFARIFVGALRARWKVVLSLLVLLCAAWPFIAAALLAVAWAADRVGGDRALLSWSEFRVFWSLVAVQLLLALGFNMQIMATGKSQLRWLWWYPLSICVAAFTLLRAGWWMTSRRVVSWRGTDYRIDAQGRIIGLK